MDINHLLFFPTSVMFIDDNRDFLLNFILLIDEDILIDIKSSPYDALKAIHERHQKYIVDLKMGEIYKSQKNTLDQLINQKFKVSEIAQEAFNPLRFSQLSVVVVDYAMPGLNGLELVKKMENAHIKRIMLSGQAETQIIEQAVKDSVIDLYIKKQDDNVKDLINASIRKLQEEYFAQVSQQLKYFNPEYKMDEFFCQMTLKAKSFIHHIFDTHNIQEYYCNDSEGSLLLVSNKGEISLMECFTQKQFKNWLSQEKDNQFCEKVKLFDDDSKYYVHIPFHFISQKYSLKSVFSYNDYRNNYQ